LKPRVPRTRAGNTWTESRFWSFIRSSLRSAFSRYPVKHAVKQKAKRTITKEKRKGNQRYEYQCACCKAWYPNKEVEVDHIIACGSLRCYDDLAGFVKRMFCEADGLQVLCKTCHRSKTNGPSKNV
jgi:hypothetical protein